jgi:hypothetical protein
LLTGLKLSALVLVTAALTALLTISIVSGNDMFALGSRQAEIAARGAQVMPFDLDATTHLFQPSADGGIQQVTADKAGDTEQIALIRAHLQAEASKFQRGDFSDPTTIHGQDMPGVAQLQAGYARITVRYAELSNGAQLQYSTDDPVLIAALHAWFAAQTSDHGQHAAAPSPALEPTPAAYAAQLSSPVRGLSAQEVDDLRNGRGAGYARMAELNSYPGPRHVLDLKDQLQLSPHQVEQIQAAYEHMDVEARQVGQEIVTRESDLSAVFARGAITEQELRERTANLGQLYARLRAIHLQAHVQITPLLSAEQIAQYNALRGYTAVPSMGGDQHRQHHQP